MPVQRPSASRRRRFSKNVALPTPKANRAGCEIGQRRLGQIDQMCLYFFGIGRQFFIVVRTQWSRVPRRARSTAGPECVCERLIRIWFLFRARAVGDLSADLVYGGSAEGTQVDAEKQGSPAAGVLDGQCLCVKIVEQTIRGLVSAAVARQPERFVRGDTDAERVRRDRRTDRRPRRAALGRATTKNKIARVRMMPLIRRIPLSRIGKTGSPHSGSVSVRSCHHLTIFSRDR